MKPSNADEDGRVPAEESKARLARAGIAGPKVSMVYGCARSRQALITLLSQTAMADEGAVSFLDTRLLRESCGDPPAARLVAD
jgi:hypothetical protein